MDYTFCEFTDNRVPRSTDRYQFPLATQFKLYCLTGYEVIKVRVIHISSTIVPFHIMR